MSVNVPQQFVQQFATNIQLLLQQKGSRLRGAVLEGTHIGEQASPVDQVGAVEMQPVAGRFAPMGRVDAPLDRRWVFPEDAELPQLLDSFDKLRLLIDPTSTYVQNAVNAAGRKFDRLIIAAANGTAYTGKNGSTQVTFPSGQQIAQDFGTSGTNTGLNVAKLKEAKRILMAADVDLDADPLFMPITAKQHDDLLAEVQIISSDYNGGDKPVLKEGKIMRFLGINFVHTELAGPAVSSIYTIPCWAKSGMYLGIWSDMQTTIDKRVDLSGTPWQAYMKMTAAASRLEEKKVVNILCKA